MEALFTSLAGGDALRKRVLETIGEAASLSGVTGKVDLHVMTFAFTDEEIAGALAQAAARHPAMVIRILADWSQRNQVRGQQVGRLAALHLPNLRVRYKHEQPYVWDAAAEKLHWSYRASRGLLHHKTLAVIVNGRPWRLICGSFNWTGAASRSYEHVLIIDDEAADSTELMRRMELEFEALWCDGRATLSPQEAHLHYRAIIDEYRRNPAISPAEVVGFAQGEGEQLNVLECDGGTPATEGGSRSRPADTPHIEIAFHSRLPTEPRGARGHAVSNRTRRFLLYTPSTSRKPAPLTMTNLALDTIFRAAPGHTLKMAMYGLSTRVPEYGALLEAARRGVRIFLLLDGTVGVTVSARFAAVSRAERLPVEVRVAARMMHQKYIVSPECATVLTGTANMSRDASLRHLEHRIRVMGDIRLAAQFCADFDTIWARLSRRVWGESITQGGEKGEVESETCDPPSTNNGAA